MYRNNTLIGVTLSILEVGCWSFFLNDQPGKEERTICIVTYNCKVLWNNFWNVHPYTWMYVNACTTKCYNSVNIETICKFNMRNESSSVTDDFGPHNPQCNCKCSLWNSLKEIRNCYNCVNVEPMYKFKVPNERSWNADYFGPPDPQANCKRSWWNTPK